MALSLEASAGVHDARMLLGLMAVGAKSANQVTRHHLSLSVCTTRKLVLLNLEKGIQIILHDYLVAVHFGHCSY